MKKILLTAGICMMSLFALQAQSAKQDAPSVEQRVDKMMTTMTSACNLTPEQAAKIKPIITEAVNERMANREQYGTDKEKLQQANNKVMSETTIKVNALLNPDQQTKFAALEQKQKQQRAAMQQGTNGGDQK